MKHLQNAVSVGYGCNVCEPEKLVAVVEKWHEENPIVTNSQMMKEVFGIDIGLPYGTLISREWLEKEYKKPEK